MSSVNNSVDTVNAAAAAIVTAESRVQPTSDQKRSWGSFWSRYWCFGTHKNTKRIGHASLFPDPVEHGTAVPADPAATNTNNSTSVVLPFIAPPSSPASFLQSDPPTATQSPGGKLAIASLSVNAFSPAGPANIFTIGPYAHEIQLVSPPVFSAYTTEPSTAAVTPPEPLQLTTPSSPEVPFAELLTKSLNRTRRNSGPNHRFALSYYDLHQLYSGSPAGNLISPGSANSASGTSSPYPDRRSILELRIADASKLFDDVKMFSKRRWGSRLGSGSLTPDGLGSASHDILPHENQISEVASLANSETGSQDGEALVDHRLSFGLGNEDVPTCVEKKEAESDNQEGKTEECSDVRDRMLRKEDNSCELCEKEVSTECTKTATWDLRDCKHRHSSISLGSVKEFNFDSTDKVVPDKSTISTAWWVDGKAEKETETHNNWTFFPLVQPGVS